MLNLGRGLKRVMQHRLQQAGGLGLRGGETGLQLIAQGHQLIDLGDDPVLFGEGRNREINENLMVDLRHCRLGSRGIRA